MSLRARPSLDVRVQRRLQRAAVKQRLTGSVTRDPKTGKVRQGLILIGSNGTATLMLPKRLEPPNVWLWTHWRTKSAAKRAWAALITRTICENTGRMSVAALETPALALGWTAPTSRVSVTITRWVVRGRGITDSDNLTFAGKGLLDCLVQTGFLVDDSTDHIDLHVTQFPSPDGGEMTVVKIAPIPAALGVPEC
jgi:hypothetical protein